MNNLKIYFYVLLTSFAVSSCGGDDVDCSGGVTFSQEFASELQNISTTAAAYSADPSAENCNAYKDAWNKYGDAIRPFGECAITAEDQADFDEALDQIIESVNQLNC